MCDSLPAQRGGAVRMSRCGRRPRSPYAGGTPGAGRGALTCWDIREQLTDDAVTILAELVASAVQHGGDGVAVRQVVHGALSVAVFDSASVVAGER
jgi:hypothetical protein